VFVGLQRRSSTRVALASAAVAILVAACGPSEQALFEEALAEGRAALAADDLELAEERLSAAGTLRPNDTEFLAAWQTLYVIVASRDLFLEAERLADSGQLLAARSTFLQVSDTDVARFDRAQAAALAAETRWLDDTAATLDDLLSAKNLVGVVLAVNRAREDFPAQILELQIIGPRAEQALKALADAGFELISEGKLSNIDNLIQRVTTIFPLSDSEGSAAVRAMSELATSERARITRIRSEEAARRQQEALQALQPSRPTAPSTSGDCPSPVTDPAGFQRCLAARLAGVGGDSNVSAPTPSPTPTEPTGPESCPTFNPGIRASLASVSGTITEDRYGLRRLALSFDGSITNVSSGWMRVFLHSYVLYYGGERENHPGHGVRLTTVEGAQEGGWLAPGSIQRLTRQDAPPHTLGDQNPTHIELEVGANLRASTQPDFCDPNGSWYFDTVRVPISY
jgi:hypothetical protein